MRKSRFSESQIIAIAHIDARESVGLGREAEACAIEKIRQRCAAHTLTLVAWTASLLLSTIVNRLADKRLRQRGATTTEEAERWAPTEAELQALRRRFIEYQALDAAGPSEWRPFREH